MKKAIVRPASRTAVLQRTAAPSGFQLSARQLWGVWVLIGWILSIAGLVIGFDWLRGYVESQPAPTQMRIEWMNLPAWITRADTAWILEQIEADVAADAQMPVFEDRLTAAVGEHLSRSPWVASVERITKQLDGAVRIWAAFREPFAFVDVKGRAYLVDDAGIHLPIEYGTDFVEGAGHDIVTGVSRPIPDVGKPWEGDDLKAGLALARFLREATRRGEAPFRSSIKAVDVSNYHNKVSRMAGRLRLKTVYPNAYVEWGLTPGDEGGVEATAAQKLENLRTAYVQLGGQLPAGRMDVRAAGGVELYAQPEQPADPKSAPKPKQDSSKEKRRP